MQNVSLAAGKSSSFLYKFLNPGKGGGIRSITLETCEVLAEALGVNARWLAFGHGPEKRDPKVVYIWDRIPEGDRDLALKVLEGFTDESDKKAS